MEISFENLFIWQESRVLIRSIYKMMETCRDFGFKDQIQRAAVSIMNNIAEGFNRSKYTNDNKSFLNFLSISYGSCGEVKSMLYLAEDLNFLNADEACELRNLCISIERKIDALTTNLKENVKPK